MDAWDTTDSTASCPSTQFSDTSDSSQWDNVKSPEQVSLDEQSFNENVILNDKASDVIRNALQNVNVTEEDYSTSS